LSPQEIAATIGKVLGKPVKYQNAPMKLFLKAARSLGLTDFVIEELSWFLQDYQRGSFGIGAPTSAVLDVGQSEPEEFETIARRYVAASAFTHRSAKTTGLAIVNLVKVLLSSTPDPRGIARRLQLPAIDRSILAADSVDWLRVHRLSDRSGRTPDNAASGPAANSVRRQGSSAFAGVSPKDD
jgi:hypothetical protein